MLHSNRIICSKRFLNRFLLSADQQYVKFVEDYRIQFNGVTRD